MRLVLLAVLMAQTSTGCTTMIVSAGGSETGTPILAHSADCVECDTRVALVPGVTHPEGSFRTVFGVNAAYPRQHSDRAAIYENAADLTTILGKIPEVTRTYGIWESTYGLINEVGLTLGESSCASKISCGGADMPDPSTGVKGPAIMCIGSLMQIALERCDSAVCAIKTMGAVAEKYGFFGEGFDEGEALTVADAHGDSWVFHITQDFSTNASAIWVAQQVPDGHIAVVANNYIIKDVPLEPTDMFLFSTNMRSEALAAGLWKGQEPFSWQDIYGKMELPMYGSIRMHWIYSETAPSLEVPLYDSPFQFPFSVKVDKKLSLEEFIELYRGNYKGMSYDMTKGVLAGPFGNPIRVEGGIALKQTHGEFARGISIARTAYTHIGYPLQENPAAFFASDTPATSVAVPLLASTLAEARGRPLDETLDMYSGFYQIGHKGVFSRSSAWWAFDIVANFMQINYRNMSHEVVFPAMKEWQERMIHAYENHGSTSALRDAQDKLVESWWKMFDTLIVRYNDGGYNFYPGHPEGQPFSPLGYPADFLRDIDFDKRFVFVQTVHDIAKRECKEERFSRWEYEFMKISASFVAGVVSCLLISKMLVHRKQNSALTQPFISR